MENETHFRPPARRAWADCSHKGSNSSAHIQRHHASGEVLLESSRGTQDHLLLGPDDEVGDHGGEHQRFRPPARAPLRSAAVRRRAHRSHLVQVQPGHHPEELQPDERERGDGGDGALPAVQTNELRRRSGETAKDTLIEV